MRRVAALVLAASVGAPLAHAEIKGFKDWMVGCDNVLSCTAMALPRQDGDPIGYIQVKREAGPAGALRVLVSVLSEQEAAQAEVTIRIDGQPYGGGPLKAEADGVYARVRFTGDDAARFAAAIVNAKSLTAQRTDKGAPGDAIDISLNGSSAALRYVDATQRRDGGATALVAKGAKTAKDVPPAPAAPAVLAKPIKAYETLPKKPAGLPAVDPDDCFNMSPEDSYLAFDLGGGATLWGVCSGTGAYNFSFDFYVASGAAKPAKIRFVAPDTGPTEWDGFLTNPYVDEETGLLSAFSKARGIGDCGDMQSWAWDGKAFQMTLHEVMDECRGISSEDWIRTYIATPK